MKQTQTTHCYTCGSQFEAQRSTAKYCSNACKTAWHRDGSELHISLNAAEYSLRRAIELMKRNPHWGNDEVYERIIELRKLISILDMNQLDQSKERVESYPLYKKN
jgi:hypothetical protein